MAIASISAASATSTNWLKEAQQAIADSASPGGLLGTLQSARSNPGSISTFLSQSQSNSNAFAQISQSTQSSAGALAVQLANTAAQKRQEERLALAQKLNPVQQNFTPAAGLDPVVYFDDGSTIDTATNIWTKANGKQIDTTTGLEYHEPGSLVSLANGAYLDTKNNILTTSDGTKIDTLSGLTITA